MEGRGRRQDAATCGCHLYKREVAEEMEAAARRPSAACQERRPARRSRWNGC